MLRKKTLGENLTNTFGKSYNNRKSTKNLKEANFAQVQYCPKELKALRSGCFHFFTPNGKQFCLSFPVSLPTRR